MKNSSCLLTAVAALVASGLIGARAYADCTPQWLPGMGIPGIEGTVNASTLWDPDGSGPLPARVTVGGTFKFGSSYFGVAYWDGNTWVAIPGNFSGPVQSLLARPDGRLVAGGFFGAVDNQSCVVASWNGINWTPLGTASSVHIIAVSALVQLPGGDIVAGGTATTILNGRGIARWNGTTWSPLGVTGIPNGKAVRALTFLPNGDLVAVGNFATMDAVTANGVARWDGTAWSAFSSGMTGGGGPRVATVTESGDLVVAGSFNNAGGTAVTNIARWDGSVWVGITPPDASSVQGVAALSGNEILLCTASKVSKWNGTSWSTSAGPAYDGSLVSSNLTKLSDGRVILGGSFSGLAPVSATNVASYSGGTWSAFGTGTDTGPRAFATLPDGRLVAAGDFSLIGGTSANRIAVFDGATWSPMGSGMNDTVAALAVLPDGRLVAGGQFTIAGGIAANKLAIWDGSSWSPFGSGAGTGADSVRALFFAPDGRLYFGGHFSSLGGVTVQNIGSWDGSNFAPLGAGADISVNALAWHNGKLIAGGDFNNAGGSAKNRIAAWNGTTWSAMGFGFIASVNGVASVACLKTLSDGTLLVGGLFGEANVNYGLAYWTGSTFADAWTSDGGVSVASVSSIAELPNGDVVVGGSFSTVNNITVNNIARRDHVSGTWSALSTGMAGYNNSVSGIGVYGSDFAVGGNFATAGGLLSSRLAFYTDDPSPKIVHPPEPVNADKGDTIELSAIVSPGISGVTFGWHRETVPMSGVFVPINDGLGGASAGGGIVSGASGSLSSPTTNATVVLSIAQARVGDSGRYRLVVENECAAVNGDAALLTITDTCPADLNADSLVDDADFVIFVSAYNILDCTDPAMPADCPADLNDDHFVDDADFTLFVVPYNSLLCP